MLEPIDIFFSNGTQYYAAGRYAAFAGLIPITGNLLHHAVENYLKGGLSKAKTSGKLKALGHNLPAIWRAFKVQVNDASLARFDIVISTLHDFEDIRYPDSVVANGMNCTIDITKAGAAGAVALEAKLSATSAAAKPKEPNYSLCLEEIDELVAALFVAASRNPKAYLGSMFKPEAKAYLIKDNAVSALTDAIAAPSAVSGA
jgi:hypothetical protein